MTLGYAIVATDYAGLGTPGRHAYLDILSNATDVINSIPAAHAAVSGLSPRWIVVGHSQGGLASLGVAELEGRIKDPNFLGTVALAGASDLADAIDNVLKVRLPVLNGFFPFWIYGVQTVYPELQENDVLTSEALEIFATSVEDGCSAASGAFAALPTEEILQPPLGREPVHQAFPRAARSISGTCSDLLPANVGVSVFIDTQARHLLLKPPYSTF